MMGKKIFYAVAALITIGIGVYLFEQYKKPSSPKAFVSGNGRIEAQEVDIVAKLPGRLYEITVKEGDIVNSGQVVAKLDTAELSARLQQAEAQIEQAKQNKNYAAAIVNQRISELSFAKKNLDRCKNLYVNNDVSLAELQRNESAVETMKAALAAAKAQVVNSESAINAAIAQAKSVKTNIEECVLRAPINASVLYRLLEPGEVVGAGGKVLTLIELDNIYMTIFLPTADVSLIKVGAEARIRLDAASKTVIPARVSFVSPDAQFTPKEIETKSEREKLMFRVKVKIDPEFLKNNLGKINTGIPADAYIKVDEYASWPAEFSVGVSKKQ